jgi:hypothetical protein
MQTHTHVKQVFLHHDNQLKKYEISTEIVRKKASEKMDN